MRPEAYLANVNAAELKKKIVWEETPYQGVFLHKVKEESDPQNPKVPKYTILAILIKPGANIPPHIHQRKAGWTETISFPDGGCFEISDVNGSKKINTNSAYTTIVHPNEIFGIKNTDISDLHFISIMKPGFTGYEEIKKAEMTKKLTA